MQSSGFHTQCYDLITCIESSQWISIKICPTVMNIINFFINNVVIAAYNRKKKPRNSMNGKNKTKQWNTAATAVYKQRQMECAFALKKMGITTWAATQMCAVQFNSICLVTHINNTIFSVFMSPIIQWNEFFLFSLLPLICIIRFKVMCRG